MALAPAGYKTPLLLLLILFSVTCSYGNQKQQSINSCGDNLNISFPFQLQGDPSNNTCNDYFYTLSCDENNRTVLPLLSGKYYVQSIDYTDHSIRLVDVGIQTNNNICSSFPLSSFKGSSDFWPLVDYWPSRSSVLLFLSCENPVQSPIYINRTRYCNTRDESGNGNYSYVVAGRYVRVRDIADSCVLEVSYISTSRAISERGSNLSWLDLNKELGYGFDILWGYSFFCWDLSRCRKRASCFGDSVNVTAVCSNHEHCLWYDGYSRRDSTNANKRPSRTPPYVRTEDINKVLKYTGVPGTRTAGRGRDASVLLGYDPAYKGFTDRRLAHPSTSAASTSTAPQPQPSGLRAEVTIAGSLGEVPISEGVPLPRIVTRRSSRLQTSSRPQTNQPVPSRGTSQSSSSGYSPSPSGSGMTSNRQPLNLSTLLTVPSRGRGRGTSGRVASTGNAPPPPRRSRGGSTHASSSPRARDSSLEATDAHRDKRPRGPEAGASDAQAVQTTESTPPSTQTVYAAWTPQLIRVDRPVNVGDSASSSETAIALAQGLLLPADMQKEASSSSDRLVSTGLVSGIKFIQKMVVLGQKFQEVEGERVRLLRENTSMFKSVTRLERERDQAKLDAETFNGKLVIAEGNLSQALAEIDNTKKGAFEEGYQKGFDAATADYVEQMPAIQDQIWVASWEACLTKIGAPDNSVLWVENDLPSGRVAANQEQEENPDDVDQIIDDFTDVGGEDQPEGQNVQGERPTAEVAVDQPEGQNIQSEDPAVNLVEQSAVADSNTGATADIPTVNLAQNMGRASSEQLPPMNLPMTIKRSR